MASPYQYQPYNYSVNGAPPQQPNGYTPQQWNGYPLQQPSNILHSSPVYTLLNNLLDTNSQTHTPSSRIGALHQLMLLLNIRQIHRSLLPAARYIWPNPI